MTVRRDIDVSSPTAASSSSGRKVIAAIGIDRYDHWQRLANAVRDATRTTELFGKLGFEQITEPLLDHDATGKAIQSLVTSDLKKLGPNDSLVLFYAGHGATYGHRPGGEEIKTGYLIPTDGSNSPDDVSTWIDLQGWLRAVALLPAKHILVILDACRSGIALDGIIERHRGDDSWQHETSAALQTRRSRRIITSALGDQVALDTGPKQGHSLFTGCLIEGLTHDLRRRGKQATTGSELGMYLQRRVDAHTKSQQTPDFGCFYHDERGEIAIPLVESDMVKHVLVKKSEPAPTKPAQSATSAPSVSAPPPSIFPLKPAVAVAPAIELAPWDASKPARDHRLEAVLDHGVPEEQGRERARTLTPLDHAELVRLVNRLEGAVTLDQVTMTLIAGLFFLVTFVLAGAVGPFAASTSGLVMLGSVVWRVIAPTRMRRVVHAVRDAPERVVLLLHPETNAWIEIRTASYRLVVKATKDWQLSGDELLHMLMRRCPTARIASDVSGSA